MDSCRWCYATRHYCAVLYLMNHPMWCFSDVTNWVGRWVTVCDVVCTTAHSTQWTTVVPWSRSHFFCLWMQCSHTFIYQKPSDFQRRSIIDLVQSATAILSSLHSLNFNLTHRVSSPNICHRWHQLAPRDLGHEIGQISSEHPMRSQLQRQTSRPRQTWTQIQKNASRSYIS